MEVAATQLWEEKLHVVNAELCSKLQALEHELGWLTCKSEQRQEQHEHDLAQKVIEFQQRQERYELEAKLRQHRAVAEECTKWEPRVQEILLLKVLASKPVTVSSTICSCTKDVDTPIPATPLVALRPSAPPFMASTEAPPSASLPFTQPSLPTSIPVPNLMLL